MFRNMQRRVNRAVMRVVRARSRAAKLWVEASAIVGPEAERMIR